MKTYVIGRTVSGLQPLKLVSSHDSQSLREVIEDRANSTGCLRYLRLAGTDLRGLSLVPGVNFEGSDLTEADLTGAVLPRARFNVTKLRGAILREVQAEHATFTLTNAEGANLTDAHLLKSSWVSANLTCANFTRADVRGVDFSATKADKAIFQDAALLMAKVRTMRIDPTAFQLSATPAALVQSMFLWGGISPSLFAAHGVTAAEIVEAGGKAPTNWVSQGQPL